MIGDDSSKSLRILVVSNLYPPFHLGGYEIVCQELVDFLRGQGHTVEVLTSTYGESHEATEQGIHRRLRFFPPAHATWFRALRQAIHNRGILRSILTAFCPDRIFLFSPWGIGFSLVSELHASGIPVVHEIADDWLLHAKGEDAWCARLGSPGRLKGPIARFVGRALDFSMPQNPDLSRSYFRSVWLRERFVQRDFCDHQVSVLPHGLNTQKIPHATGKSGLVVSGRLCQDKGSDVFVRALEILSQLAPNSECAVSIVGGGEPEFVAQLKAQSQQLPSPWRPHFYGHCTREDALRIVAEHSIFIFPVVWNEPFGLAPLEAMAAGLVVVATRTGGAAEYLQDGYNCLEVSRGDPNALAQAVARLMNDSDLRLRLIAGGAQTVQRFSHITAYTAVEIHLQNRRVEASS